MKSHHRGVGSHKSSLQHIVPIKEPKPFRFLYLIQVVLRHINPMHISCSIFICRNGLYSFFFSFFYSLFISTPWDANKVMALIFKGSNQEPVLEHQTATNLFCNCPFVSDFISFQTSLEAIGTKRLLECR